MEILDRVMIAAIKLKVTLHIIRTGQGRSHTCITDEAVIAMENML